MLSKINIFNNCLKMEAVEMIDFWRDLDMSYMLISVYSVICFFLIFKYVSPVVSHWIFPGLADLPLAKQIDWHTRFCSTVHAMVVSCLCLYVMFMERDLVDNPVWEHSPVVRSSCAIVTGYLIADCLAILYYYEYIGDPFYIIHHLASVFAYLYVMCYGVYAFFANYRLMAEFSTPWVNNRWFLDVMDKKSTKLYFHNGLILTAIFFLCRIFALPYCWYMIYSVYGTQPFEATAHSKYVLIFSCFSLDVLNIYWGYKLLKGVHKTLKKMDANKKLTRQKAG